MDKDDEKMQSEDRFYFVSKNIPKIIAIYRLVVNAEEEWVKELFWKDGKWEETDTLMRRIIGLDIDLHEVDVEIVKEMTPWVDVSPYKKHIH